MSKQSKKEEIDYSKQLANFRRRMTWLRKAIAKEKLQKKGN